jgi:hypothetical protein
LAEAMAGSYVPPSGHGAKLSEPPPTEASRDPGLLREEKYHRPEKATSPPRRQLISTHSRVRPLTLTPDHLRQKGPGKRESTDRLCRIDESLPFDFRPEALEEVLVVLCFADLDFDVFELEGEVVGRAGTDVAGEDVAGESIGGKREREEGVGARGGLFS